MKNTTVPQFAPHLNRIVKLIVLFAVFVIGIILLPTPASMQSSDALPTDDAKQDLQQSPQTSTRPEILWMRGGTSSAFSVIKYSANGQTCATVSYDSTIKIWRSSDGVLLRTIFLSGYLTTLSLSADGQKVATVDAGTNTIKVFQVSDGSLLTSIPASTVQGTNVAISPDGSLVSNASKIFRTSDGTLVQDLSLIPENGTTFTSSAFSPNGQLLAINRGYRAFL